MKKLSMNLGAVKSVEDRGNHFHVTHANHGSFKVSKKGLDKLTLQGIQALCQGGPVKGYAEGGDVDPYTPSPFLDGSPILSPVPPMGTSAQVWQLSPQGQTPDNSVESPAMMKDPSSEHEHVWDFLKQKGPLRSWEMKAGPEQDAARAQEATEYQAKKDAEAKAAVTPTEKQPALPEQPGAAQPPAQMAGFPQLPGMNFKGMNQEEQANKDAADVAGKMAADQKAVQDQYNAQVQARQQTFDANMKAQQAEYDQIKQGIIDQKLNPNRLWTQMGTGGKISAALGMVLGGIGAALTGGTNTAAQIITQNIDRDIDAQKTELGKKDTLLQMNLKRMGNLQDAENVTRAQMLSAVQGQLAAVSSKYGGDAAKAHAELLNGQLEQQKAGIQYQISAQRAQMQFGQQQQAQVQGAMARVLQGQGTQQDEAALNVIGPKDFGERIVTLPSGARAAAKSKEGAKAYQEETMPIQQAQSIVAQLKADRAELGFGSLSRQRRAEVENRVKGLIQMLPSALAGIKRMTATETTFGKEMTPIPSNFLDTGVEGKLKSLSGMLEDKARLLGNTYLVKPVDQAISTRRPGEAKK